MNLPPRPLLPLPTLPSGNESTPGVSRTSWHRPVMARELFVATLYPKSGHESQPLLNRIGQWLGEWVGDHQAQALLFPQRPLVESPFPILQWPPHCGLMERPRRGMMRAEHRPKPEQVPSYPWRWPWCRDKLWPWPLEIISGTYLRFPNYGCQN